MDGGTNSLPLPHRYAIRIFSQPCGSLSCEKNWGAFEAAQTENGSIAHAMLDNLVYVRMNKIMIEKFNKLKAHEWHLFNLEKLSD